MRCRTTFCFALSIALAGAGLAQRAHLPNPQELLASHQRGEQVQQARESALKLSLTPRWIDGGTHFWYRNALHRGKEEFWLVESATGKKSPAFDAGRLAVALGEAIGRPVDPGSFPFDEIEFANSRRTLRFRNDGKQYDFDLATGDLKSGPIVPNSAPEGRARENRSEDGKWATQIVEGRLKVVSAADGATAYECPIENVAGAVWAPGSTQLVVHKRIHGDRKPIYLIRSSPAVGSRAELVQRLYDQPGDRLDTFESYLVDPMMKRETRVDLPAIWTGGQPWAGAPPVQWLPGGKEFLVGYAERGYGRYFIDAVSAETGKRRNVVDEDPPTFFDTTAAQLRVLAKTPEILWRSERDGFGRMYLIDAATGSIKNPITPAGWVVRGIEHVDEANRRMTFSANLTADGEDPYFIHYFSVGFDGRGLVRLTEGNGTHRAVFSPDRQYLVNTWSRVDAPPVHELRRVADGKRIVELERADLSEWKKFKLAMPEVFVAKGRDGKTDIWGIVHRPSNFDPGRKYPVIESIYAGPHDSHVPKSFSPLPGVQRLAELGFVVVQIDGMGTRNRGKAFHDVCHKNIADAGFPDRILWMKALGQKYAWLDLDRVGIYGTSAGGQSSAGALLFHPDFYKVAVSACGCHDNRIDKTWWNEQWMGPIGPHYEQQSNITHAKNLKGRLMLIVGELDRNVPPESTFRFADALIKANRDFELVVIPGADHTSGGPYGDRKRMDFFVKHLLGVEPPNWNAESPGGG